MVPCGGVCLCGRLPDFLFGGRGPVRNVVTLGVSRFQALCWAPRHRPRHHCFREDLGFCRHGWGLRHMPSQDRLVQAVPWMGVYESSLVLKLHVSPIFSGDRGVAKNDLRGQPEG